MTAKNPSGFDSPISESQGGTGATTFDNARDNLGISADVLGKTASYLTVVTDRGRLIQFSGAGPYTLTLDLASSLTAGWTADVRNDTATTLTVACSGADTINGAASITLQIGQSVTIFCNGAVFYTTGEYGLSPAGALLIANNLSDLANVATARSNLGDSQLVNAQTAGYTAVSGDRGKIIRYTGAGGVTLALDPAATLGDGYFVNVRNSSSGNITVDPDGAELINGVASIVIMPGQAITIFCNGSTFYTIGEYTQPLSITGGTMTGTLTLNADPVNPLEAATKQYADSIASGIAIKEAVVAASTVALTVTYANGAAGVGATLTNNGVQATFALDGLNPIVNDRVLIKDQASQLQNGIYTVTNVGSGATNWVLTRATDYDSPSEITPGTLIPVASGGTVNGGSSWIESATVTAVGTDPIIFSIFTQPASSLAPSNAQYLTLATDSTLTQERVFTPTGGMKFTDGGAGGSYTGVTEIPHLAKTLAYMAVSGDRAKVIEYTGAGIVTLSLDSAATLGDGWYIVVVNNAADDILIEPTVPDLLWGFASIGLRPGQAVQINCDGTNFYSVGEYQPATDACATIALDNLVATNINTSLEPDTDSAYNLGHPNFAWDILYTKNLKTSHTIGETYILSAWENNTTFDKAFITLTAGVFASCALDGDVTSVTQAANNNSTKLATTAYVDAATGGGSGANTALSNLAAVAINTTLVDAVDITDDLGTQAIRWRNVYAQSVQTGDTNADTLTFSAWDVDGSTAVPFFTLTAGNTPTGVLSGSVTGTTQAASDNSTKLATTAYADTQVSTIAANKALSNLSSVAINTSLLPGSDNAIDLGSGTKRTRQIFSAGLTTGTSAGNTLIISARDVDGASETPFITLTANNNPTCVLASGVTGTTQSASDNSTKLATTAYVDNQVTSVGANKALSNLASVAINTSLLPGSDNAIDVGDGTHRTRQIYSAGLTTGRTAADTLIISARDVDGASDTAFITLTANNTPTCAIASAVTGVTQSAGDNSTKLATTAYADTAAAARAPNDATYIVQTASAGLSNEQALGALATGILKSTTTTGVVSIAVAGTDYYAPGGTDVAVADGGTGVSSFTAYAVICGGTTSTGALQSIASVGTSGQVLTSNGAGALPTMQSAGASSGNWVYITDASASGSTTLDFAQCFTSTYETYVLIFENAVPGTTNTQLTARFGTGGTPTWQATLYSCAGGTCNTSSLLKLANLTTALVLGSTGQTTTSTQNGQGHFFITNVNSSSNNKGLTGTSSTIDGTSINACYIGSLWGSATVVTSLRIIQSSGTLSTGRYWVYGIKPS